MKSNEIIERIEKLIDNKIHESDEVKTEKESKSNKSIIGDIKYLVLQFFINILKAPFRITANILWQKLITTIKNDAKLYALIMAVMVALFVFLSVLWLFISIAVGVYFFEKGHSMSISIIYSIGFQILSIITISLIAYLASKNIKSLALITKLTSYGKSNK